jgi:putative membrane protein
MARRFWWTVLPGAVACALPVTTAFAHSPVGPSATQVAKSWTFDPAIVLPIILVSWLYDLGVRRLWRRFGRGHAVSYAGVAAFAAGMVLLAVALVSPLDGLSATLFSAHMSQHMLLVLAVPPLLLIGRVDLSLAAALPPGWQRSTRHWIHRQPTRRLVAAALHPVTAWLLFAAVFWAWHAPVLYEAALRHDAIHAAEHLTLLITGLAFWRVILRAAGQRDFVYPFAILFVFTTMLQMSVLAALLTFSGDAWYPAYGATSSAWGISLLTDQRTGALVMWMTSNAAFLGVVVVLFMRWFAAEERRADRQAVALPRGS